MLEQHDAQDVVGARLVVLREPRARGAQPPGPRAEARLAVVDRAHATQSAIANALNSAADRIERTTQVLNRTIGGGVAIG